MVEYFDIEGVEGKYFACARYGTMSVAACVRNFGEAPTVVRSGRLQGCLGCPIGKDHAGPAVVQPEPRPAALVYRAVCVRCRRSSRSEGARLLGRMRLIRNQTICVSCFNREREVLRGANAKGATPKKWNRLFRTTATYVSQGALQLESLATPVIDRSEALLTILRRTPGQVAFAWSRPPRVIA